MGDAFKKVHPGEKMQFPARMFNTLVDMTNERAANRQNTRREAGTPLPPPGVILLVRNDSGADRERFEVLGVDDLIFPLTDNTADFAHGPVMKGKTPSDPDHLGSFVVLLEPIKSGKIGRAMIQGAVYVQVKIETSDVDEWADIDDGETGQLKATKDGSARIIYRRSGGTNGDWCVCLLGTGKSGPGVGTELQVYMTKLQDGILTGIWDYPRLHG